MSTASPLITPPEPTDAGRGTRLVAGLEAIIDATAGILSAQSFEATLQAMADALLGIVPYTSLAVYEVDWTQRVCIPLLATGRYIEQTLSSRADLETSITGSAVLGATLVYRGPGDPAIRANVMPGTPVNDAESIVVAPLLAGERTLGTLNVWREDDQGRVERVRFGSEELMLIERFASLASIAYANSTQREQLRTQALTDALTGVYNRRFCETSMRATLQDGERYGEPTSIAYFDIDAFKSINDHYGHGCGDEALCAFADALRVHTRVGDIVCRSGGEEFIVILPRTDSDQARRLAERVNRAVREARLGPWANLTVSAGVATSAASRDGSDALIRRADAGLLMAKRAGRDRVVVVADAPSA
jgi:diguanylate cyclase (GGDEF)-like protein